MAERNYIVYKHTSPSNKVYIGITGQKAEARWNKGNGYRYCPYFYRAIQKYGWDNIKHEVLISGLTEEEACAKEIELIALYKSTDPKFGYNDLVGGTSGKHGRPYSAEQLKKMSEGQKRVWDNPEYRERMSNAHKGKVLSEEQRRKISLANKGRVPWSKGRKASAETLKKMSEASLKRGCKPPSWAGKHHTEEAKRKIGEAHKGFNPFSVSPMTDEHRRICAENAIRCSKAVYQIKDGVIVAEFSSGAEATRQTGINNISKVCKHRARTAGGYEWIFKEEYDGISLGFDRRGC